MSLFPERAGGAGGRGGRGAAETVLYRFKAGKMIMSARKPNGKFDVTADPRRGEVSITRSGDGVVHFKWTNMQNSVVEDDRMVFMGENTFKKVKTGRPTDRVFMLKYISGNQQHMYWMQDVATDKDDEAMTKINEYIANPNLPSSIAPPAAPAVSATPAGGASGIPGMPGMNPDELMAMLGRGGAGAPLAGAAPPTVTTQPPAAPPAATGALAGLDFNALLNNMSSGAATAANIPPPVAPATAPPAATSAPASSSSSAADAASAPAALTVDDLRRAMGLAGAPAAVAPVPSPALRDIVSAEEVINTGILNDPNVQAELLSLLPTEESSSTAATASTASAARLLESTLRSAQLQQSVGALDRAISQPENYNSVMSNFGIDPQPGTAQLYRGDTSGAFVTSLSAANPPATATAAVPPPPDSEEKKEEEKKNNDDGSGPMDK